MISNRVNSIKPSLTIATNIKAQELKRAGRDIIVLAAGQPDFDTPDHIKDAAIKAINEGFTKYVPGKGTPDLQAAIQRKFKEDNNLDYDLANITVGVGGKHIIYNAFSATINSGDEVIIPAPYWVSYPDIVVLNDGTPVVVECGEDSGFKIQLEDLEKNISSKTKWLMLNSPSNPTGSMYTKKELIALGEVLKKHDHVYVLSDDIYEKIVYDGNIFHTIAEVCPFLFDRTLTMNGLSKSYCMTGWRVGYAAGPTNIINAMNKVQSQNVSSTASISMAASVEDFDKTGRRVSIEYALIKDMNDHDWRAQLLADKLNARGKGWVHINPIPLNPTPGSVWTASTEKQTQSFVSILEDNGIPTTLRHQGQRD